MGFSELGEISVFLISVSKAFSLWYLWYVIKFKVVNNYAVAFINAHFNKAVEYTACFKHSLEILEGFVVVKVGSLQYAKQPFALNEVNVVLASDGEVFARFG